MSDTGFYVEENVFSKEECERLIAALSNKNIKRSRAGARNLMHNEVIAEFASDWRLTAITEKVFGKALIPYKATLFEKTGKANWLVAWHQDTALPVEWIGNSDGWGALSKKGGILFAQAPTSALSKILALRIHLDASTKANGPLRILKGSHRFGVMSGDEIESAVKDGEAVECLVGRGGVLAMSPLLLHASSKTVANQSRRVLHIEYTDSLDIAHGTRLAIS